MCHALFVMTSLSCFVFVCHALPVMTGVSCFVCVSCFVFFDTLLTVGTNLEVQHDIAVLAVGTNRWAQHDSTLLAVRTNPWVKFPRYAMRSWDVTG